jgi:[ribosomal protein S18]-alanine N-acetyltransferase
MSAFFQPQPAPEARFEAMTPAWLDAVVQVENSAYDYPWTAVHFSDALQTGYQAQMLMGDESPNTVLLGYFVAMKGVDEVHLLNMTVAPAYQRQGWARVMLDALCIWSRSQSAQWLWLEVRVSNLRAHAIYQRHGFCHVGTRRNYYPASAKLPQPEDAIVMRLAL